MGNKRLAAGMRPMGPNQLDWIIYKGLCICLELSVKQGRRGLFIINKALCICQGRSTELATRGL